MGKWFVEEDERGGEKTEERAESECLDDVRKSGRGRRSDLSLGWREEKSSSSTTRNQKQLEKESKRLLRKAWDLTCQIPKACNDCHLTERTERDEVSIPAREDKLCLALAI